MSISFVYEMDQIKVLVTNECNLHCTHCFRSEESLPQMISFVKLCEIVDFAIESKTRKLSFSGGEFFTHPKAYDLLDYCRGKDIDIAILTNATCLDIEYFKKNVNERRIRGSKGICCIYNMWYFNKMSFTDNTSYFYKNIEHR